jgi:ATP-dependent RNA helicase SUPV3L1/SUV3
MLTRRNDPSPQMTWAADAAHVLSGAYDEAAGRRLQSALKVLLKR